MDSDLTCANRPQLFKNPENIVVGEWVYCAVDDPGWGKLSGEVRDKTTALDEDSGGKTRVIRFFVSLDGMPDKEALVDCKHIWRERKTFTKQILRSFLKNSVHREAWSGAPWCVKDHLAAEHDIPTRIPSHLTHEHQVAQRKLTLNHKKSEFKGEIMNFFSPSKGFPQLKPKGQKRQVSAVQTEEDREQQYQEYQRALCRNPNLGAYGRSQPINGDPNGLHFVNHSPPLPSLAARGAVAKPAPPPLPPPVKYPREDLENAPSGPARPELKFLTKKAPTSAKSLETDNNGILMESVGLLLETWDTLNVYCEVFWLDSFTFDDYVEALQYTSEDGTPCELLVEIHCALLKKLVNHERDLNGQVQIDLPDEESSDDEPSRPSSAESTPTPEPEVPARTTRGSLAKSEAAELKAQAASQTKPHRASEVDQCVKGYDWKARLRKRDLANGRWVVALVGLLNLFSLLPSHKQVCDKILVELAPLDLPPTEDTVISQYEGLNVNLRIRIVQFLCMLTMDTQAIRNYMEDCTASMTKFRKEKIEWQRKRKAL